MREIAPRSGHLFVGTLEGGIAPLWTWLRLPIRRYGAIWLADHRAPPRSVHLRVLP